VVAVGAVDVALFSEDVLSNGEFHQLSPETNATSFGPLQDRFFPVSGKVSVLHSRCSNLRIFHVRVKAACKLILRCT